MNDYFESIVKETSFDELQILGFLSDEDATETFKSIPRKDVIDQLSLKRTKGANVIKLLEVKKFVKITKDAHQMKLCITNIGQIALEESLRGADV